MNDETYREKGGLAVATYPKQALRLKDNHVRVPLGKTAKSHLGKKEIFLPFPSNLDFKQIKELRILPRNQEFYLEWVYETPEVKKMVNSETTTALADSALVKTKRAERLPPPDF